MKYFTSAAILVVASTIAFAQAPVKPAPVKAAEICTTTVEASGLTGCEQATLDSMLTKANLLMTQSQMLQSQYNSIQQNLASTIELLKKKYPGMDYAPPSQQFPVGSMVKHVEPAPVKK